MSRVLTQTATGSESWWQRAFTLLVGCAAVCFALMVADLVAWERELKQVPGPDKMLPVGLVVGPLGVRVRGGDAEMQSTTQVAADDSAPTGELARGIARYRGELAKLITGRRMGGVACLSVDDLVRVLGGELEQPAPDGPATFLCPVGVVEVTPGSTAARRNFQPVQLSQPPVVIDGKLYLPLRALEELADVKVTWDEARRRFLVKSGDSEREAVMLEDMFDLEIDRSDRTLEIRYLGHHLATWSVCVGAGNNTPVGTFHIQNKAEWAGWRAYWGEYIPGGSRRNPLGARWLGTTARGRETGRVIGIHGTNQPSSIGQRISGGCVRLTNAHAIELYNIIPIGTRVVIHE